MKFALRDDDLNFYYTPEEIHENYKDIWDICPVSMSVVPFIKGNWKENVIEAEKRGPGKYSQIEIDKIKADNQIYPIGDNIELVNFINKMINQKKIYLTFHAIHHRNEDPILPQLNNNFGMGAEFYTSRDLTQDLNDAIKYLEEIFNQKIDVFTPPQNLLNNNGIKAVVNNNLAICGDLPSIKSFSTLKLFGLSSYAKILFFKLKHRSLGYPFPIINKKLKQINHFRLQPGTDLIKLYSDLDLVHKLNGVYVLSTHSYGFNVKMKNSEKTMGEVLIEIIDYANKKPNVEFVTLNEVFK